MPESRKLEVIVLPSGVSTTVLGSQAYDWASIRILAEKGVAYTDIAKRFNGLDTSVIAKKAHAENWMTPAREKKMLRELGAKQREALSRTGQARDPEEVMAEIWEDRARRTNEKAFEIAEAALNGVTEEVAASMIAEAKDLKTVVDVTRTLTCQARKERVEDDQGPKMAIAIGFLRSAGPDCPQPTLDA